jgi:hypothetical protein
MSYKRPVIRKMKCGTFKSAIETWDSSYLKESYGAALGFQRKTLKQAEKDLREECKERGIELGKYITVINDPFGR